MHTTINATDTEIVEEHRDGDRYLVAKNVPIVCPQRLANGYVPEESVANSTDLENTHGGSGWDGLTATLNHPRNLPEFGWFDEERQHGEPVLAANDRVRDTLGLGSLENDRYDGEYVRVDVAVNADRAASMGGEAEDIVATLEDNEPLDVSTQYVGAELPPGEYDGEHRERAEAIVAPDSLALLPNESGQCSLEDGCGVNAPSAALATANDLTVTVNTGHAGADDPDATPSSEETGEDADGVGRVVRQAVRGALEAWRGPGAGDLPAGVTRETVSAAAEAATNSTETTGAATEDDASESPADNGGQTATPTMDREDLIRKITEHSNIKMESLEGMGDSCLQTTHEHVVGDDPDDDDDDGDADADGDDADDDGDADDPDDADVDDDGNVVVANKEELEELVDSRVEERVAANQERRQREERVDRIVANSSEYGDDDREELLDTPEGVLDRIEQGLSEGTQVPAASGPSPTPNSAGDDVDLDELGVGTGEIDDTASGGD